MGLFGLCNLWLQQLSPSERLVELPACVEGWGVSPDVLHWM